MKKILWILIPFVLAFAAGYIFLSQKNKQILSPTTSSSTLPSPSPSSIFENPPKESLTGQISLKTGDVFWVSRTATDSAKLIELKPVLQGEEYDTGDNGNLTVSFPNILSVAILPNSKVNFAQTLPQNLVLVQEDGTVDYKQQGSDIISIRALSLLVRENAADAKITVDTNNQKVTVLVISGSITAGYEDLNQTSHLVNVASGQQLIFDEATRTVRTP